MRKPPKPTGPFDPDSIAAHRLLPRGEFAYRVLKDALANGRLHSGDRMREEEIARALGVSRTPVREALNRLLSRGLLEVAPGRGLVVTQFDRQQIMEIYALREVLEATAASLAAQHASSIEIGHLRELLKQFAASVGDIEKLQRINRLFHQTIYEASHNRYLIQWHGEFRDTMALLPYVTYGVDDRFRSAHAEHGRVVDAIEARDSAAAEQAAREHVRKGQVQRLKMLFQA